MSGGGVGVVVLAALVLFYLRVVDNVVQTYYSNKTEFDVFRLFDTSAEAGCAAVT